MVGAVSTLVPEVAVTALAICLAAFKVAPVAAARLANRPSALLPCCSMPLPTEPSPVIRCICTPSALQRRHHLHDVLATIRLLCRSADGFRPLGLRHLPVLDPDSGASRVPAVLAATAALPLLPAVVQLKGC